MHAITRSATALVAVLVLSLAAVGAASAHSHYVSSTPAASASVAAAPTSVTIVFGETVVSGTTASVTDPSGATVSTGAQIVTSDPDRKTLSVALKSGLPNGVYKVSYKSVSDDGAILGGTFAFGVNAAVPASLAKTETELTGDNGAPLAPAQLTASYRLTLEVGPVAPMLMPEQVAGATSGEAMVAMPGMAMAPMSMTDQGQPVNHHLEVHVYDRSSGAVVSDRVPSITVAGPGGAARPVSPVVAMYDIAVGRGDLHYGNNVYLPDGRYTVTAQIGGETATFPDVAVGGAGQAAPAAMPGMAMPGAAAPTQLPRTGGPVDLRLGLAAGVAALLAGAVARRRTGQPTSRRGTVARG